MVVITMTVNEVTHSNLDKLYEAILIANNNPDYKKEMGENIIVILRDVRITMTISDVTEFEAYMLKMFSNDQNIWITEQSIDVNGCGENNTANCAGIHQLSTSMLNDNDVGVKPGALFFNTGNIKNTVVVSFTGYTLFNILSTLPDQFFKKYNIQQTKEKGLEIQDADNLPPIIDFGESLNNFIVNEFANHFWDFFKRSVNVIDLGTDSYINSKYYTFVKPNKRDIVMANAITPYGDISFIDGSEGLSPERVDACKRNFTDIPMDKRNLPFKSTTITFVINCDFYTFLEMFLALPSSYFINKQDVKTLFLSDQIFIDPMYENYKTRIAVRISECMHMKNSVSKESDNNLIRYNYIPLVSSYKFTMKLSLNDITSEIFRYEKLIKDGYYSYNCNDYLSYSILYIIENIKKYSLAVYKLLANEE